MSRFTAFCLYLVLFAASLGAAVFGVVNYRTLTRGVEAAPPTRSPLLGTNTALEQYADEAALQRALGLLQGAGLTAIRQHFPWREIEATRGQYDWAKWDRIVEQAHAANLQIVAVLDTAPAWAQRDYERDLPEAPPANFQDYADFTGAFARRYAGQIAYYQIWDEPNVHPNWGRRNADPAEYAQMLGPAAAAIRANDPRARIVLAGLAMNVETQRPHPDYSDILFLRGLYEAGAQNDFDVVAAKPYGMWSGPEDRRVSPEVLNFSRVILLREEMKAHGDANKPLWAVELGWNALPANWAGPPSPWGSDSETVQSDRLARALARARGEWPWMGALFPQMLQPDAPPDDPRWGFALLTPDFQPRPFYTTIAAFTADPPPLVPPAPAPWLPVALLGGVALVAAWRGARLAAGLPREAWWRAVHEPFTSLPEPAQLAVLAAAVAAFYFSPRVPLNFVLLVLLVPLFALRLDLGLGLTVFTIPFFLYPKTLFGGFNLSPVEVLTLVSVAAWGLRTVVTGAGRPRPYIGLTSLDWAVVVFVVLGVVSVRFAGNFGVAIREFRVIVVEPALLYALLRVASLSRAQIWRLVNALLLAGVAVCLIGLIQIARGDVIAAGGLGRVHAVWESPNNAALFLGHLLPLALALALLLPARRTRRLYAVAAVLLAITIYLTFSFGALFVGIPASLVFLALVWLARRRVPRRVVLAAGGGLLVVGALALIPLAGSARFQTLFQTGTGTGFFRVAVWISALRMIRDHPLLGVGLDNFLYEYPKYILPEAWREPNLSHPHNVILDFWVRLGVLGVVVLAWMEVEFFRRGWRAFAGSDARVQALAVGLMASMVDFLAHGMIDAAYFVVDLAFVFMFTLGVVAQLSLAEQ